MRHLATYLTLLLATVSLKAETIKITFPNWIDGVAISHLAKAVLEDKLGYDVLMTVAEPSEVYASVASGEQDLFLDAWLPYTQSEYFDKYSLQLERLGTMLERTKIGLAVPEYMEVESIAELAGVADSLGGTITGIEADAGITNSTNIVIREYGLPLKQVNSSTSEMLAALDEAIAAQEPIVVTAWTPHWMFAAYDIKMLNDPNNIYIPDGLRKFARSGFSDTYPEAALFLGRFSLTEDQLNELLFAIKKSDGDAEGVAKAWVADNAELVEAWTKPEEKKGLFRGLFN